MNHIAPACQEFDQWLQGLERKAAAKSEGGGNSSSHAGGSGKSSHKSNRELRQQVKNLISELTETQERLKQEIRKRHNIEDALELQLQRISKLEAALNILLEKREADRRSAEANILSSVRNLILPCLERLKKSGLNREQGGILKSLESSLEHIVSPFVRQMSSEQHPNFTPTEMQVADFVRQGKTNKEIAELLCISVHTVMTHRHNIRVRLGLKNKKINLRTYLISLIQN
jgi:DNA-binding CsgD family transcriptional regulator